VAHPRRPHIPVLGEKVGALCKKLRPLPREIERAVLEDPLRKVAQRAVGEQPVAFDALHGADVARMDHPGQTFLTARLVGRPQKVWQAMNDSDQPSVKKFGFLKGDPALMPGECQLD
jgi:hypothetical protein